MPNEFPTGDEPYGGVGPQPGLGAPPGFGGLAGGNPFNTTLRGSTPPIGRRLLGRPGTAMLGQPPMQLQSAPMGAPALGNPGWGARPEDSYPGNLDTPGASTPAFTGSGPPATIGGQQYSPTGQPREWSPYTDPQGGFSPKSLIDYLLAIGYREGSFDPAGSQGLHNALSKFLEDQGRNDIRKAGIGAQLYGYDDPMGQQYVRQNAEQSVRDRIAAALSGGDFQSIQGNQDLLHNLLMAYFGAVGRRDPKSGDSAGAAAGQLAGAGIGALAGG